MALKLVIYTDDWGAGGAGEYTHNVALGLSQRGFEVVYVQTRVDKPAIGEREAAGIRHAWLDYDTLGNIPAALDDKLTPARIFAQERPDLVLFSDCLPESLAGAKEAAAFLDIPFVSVKHFVAPDTWAAREPAVRKRVEAALNKAFRIVPVSHENRIQLQKIFDIAPERFQVIYNGRQPRFFVPRSEQVRAAMRREWNIPSDAFVVLTVAQFHERKGHRFIAEAMASLKAKGQIERFHFVWVSLPNPELVKELTAVIDQAGCADHLHIIGHRDDIDRCLDASDAFLLPSMREGMPLVIIEAMAKGVPVIASAVSGIPEELGDCGVLLPDPNNDPLGTVREIGRALLDWRDNPARFADHADRSRQRANRMFREERMLGELTGVLNASVFPEGDYVSPGFERIRMDRHFPSMTIGDRSKPQWPYFRGHLPHNLYVDRRQPLVGFLNRDEIHILYNNALQFRGRRALEIGCWLGWSAVHLAAAGVELDVVDPVLAQPDFRQSILASIRSAGLGNLRFIPGTSPQMVRQIAETESRRWSLFFIDGDHETPGPLLDAKECINHAERDAMMIFHDLAAPAVSEGLRFLKEQGWNTRIYDTTQIMAAAWRGDVVPVDHTPDPRIVWQRPSHLADLG